jgi:hypothetical protein
VATHAAVGDPVKSTTLRLVTNTALQYIAVAAQRCRLAELQKIDTRQVCHNIFASHQAMGGIQALGLQTLLGHRDGRVTARYSRKIDAYPKAPVDGI